VQWIHAPADFTTQPYAQRMPQPKWIRDPLAVIQARLFLKTWRKQLLSCPALAEVAGLMTEAKDHG
jgi:hypothetical protein